MNKDNSKNNYLKIMNSFKDKIGEVLNKKVDFSLTFDPSDKLPVKKERVKEQDHEDMYRQGEREESAPYTTEDLQRCKIGEDILFDPYYTTKLINKMRLFNLFKMGSKRLKFDEDQFRKNG
jgi:hypothetical protein